MKKKIAFVPTMGALHQGHLELGKIAREHAENVIYSIFVNPTQFAPNEDFNKYPRNLQADIDKLDDIADHIYTPSIQDIYPQGVKATLKAGSAAQGLESTSRPHFFDGVVTVVSKLFQHTRPDVAIFGEKDFQQLMVIREMNFKDAETGEPVEIIGAPTMREPDGLAMSSRNAYLSLAERQTAPKLHQIISSEIEIAEMKNQLQQAGFKIDYIEHRWGRILAAVWLGKTRLIDNVAIDK